MPVFISYSHSDKDFVDTLAEQLVLRNAHVWVDRWELNVGDSILNNVQNAIQDASALIVVLSKASVHSEWCKKELSAGLMRELDERRVDAPRIAQTNEGRIRKIQGHYRDPVVTPWPLPNLYQPESMQHQANVSNMFFTLPKDYQQ